MNKLTLFMQEFLVHDFAVIITDFELCSAIVLQWRGISVNMHMRICLDVMS